MGAAAIPIALALAAGSTAYQIKSGEDAKKDARKQNDETVRRQEAGARDQEAKLNAAPRKLDRQGAPLMDRRARAGLAANIKTSGLGAPALAPAALTGKALLGQ